MFTRIQKKKRKKKKQKFLTNGQFGGKLHVYTHTHTKHHQNVFVFVFVETSYIVHPEEGRDEKVERKEGERGGGKMCMCMSKKQKQKSFGQSLFTKKLTDIKRLLRHENDLLIKHKKKNQYIKKKTHKKTDTQRF